MAKRDYSDTGQRSQSDELFEDIFQLALTKEQRKKKGTKPAVQTDKKSRPAVDAPPARKRNLSPAPPLQRGTAKPQERKAEKAPRKRPRSGRGIKILITLLLFVLAGAAATFLFPGFNVSDLFQKAPVQSTIKREMPRKPSKKTAVREPEKPTLQVPVHVPPPVPSATESGAAKTETPLESSAPVKKDMAEGGKSEAIVEVPAQPSAPANKETLPADGRGTPAPRANQTALQSKTPATPAPPLSPAKAKSFPYSVYLGSFKKQEALDDALAIYAKKGLSPYVVRMDLGEKGVWMRVFTGHFESREEAEGVIKKTRIPEAEAKHTRYAVLLGESLSKQEAETRVKALEASGCHPYLVGDSQTGQRIYSGAYYRMEDAEKELAWLASKGVKGKIVER